MGRTIKDIEVYGRNIQEVRDEVIRWMNDNKIKTDEQREDFIKGRIGTPGGLGLTAPKYFEISFKQAQSGTIVHTVGFIGVYGVSESSFDKDAVMGMIPRRKGWEVINDLWRRLESLSHNVQYATNQVQQYSPQPSGEIKFCPYCGTNNPGDYKFCAKCQKPLP
ncbi:MAG: zinc ribbon domain-containing protein [Candidatus Thermoplasmatota archaeon]|nr:zinc ribbon domain-containing protein [Euryarchaeota archaeon]MBU4144024.1 zinc ribbon domain-containing protein [Candidatus Thermoplasmatota archaeon]MBU4591862.1 zinc ribbon domain-containing protein [Candidatus Thermoplasmatota archaeon]